MLPLLVAYCMLKYVHVLILCINLYLLYTECVTCCEATSKTTWLRNVMSGFKIVESISSTLTICCDNTIIMNFSQMMKVMPIQSILILCINLLERSYTSMVFIATNYIFRSPPIKCLCIKLFMKK